MKHSSTIYDERICIRARLDPQGKVLLEFLLKTLLKMARCDELSFLTEERRVVDTEEHAHRWLIHLDRRQRFRILEISNSISDFKSLKTYHCTYIATLHLLHLRFSEAIKDHQFLYSLLLLDIIALAQSDVHTCLQSASCHPSHCDTTHIWRILQ